MNQQNNGRMTEVDFLKHVPALGDVTVAMQALDTIVLHDSLLAELFHISAALPEMEATGANGIYEHRETILRILDRLTGRPNQTAGRSSMRINKQRITAGEREVIRCTLKKLLNYDNKDLGKRLRVVGSKLSIQVRRDKLSAMLKHVEEASSIKIPVVSPEIFKGEKGLATNCTHDVSPK